MDYDQKNVSVTLGAVCVACNGTKRLINRDGDSGLVQLVEGESHEITATLAFTGGLCPGYVVEIGEVCPCMVCEVPAFTLRNLLALLQADGYEIIASGADVARHFAAAAELLGLSHTPLFFVTVRGSGELLDFTTPLMSYVWSKFTRGQMEFNGRMIDGRPQVTVVETAS